MVRRELELGEDDSSTKMRVTDVVAASTGDSGDLALASDDPVLEAALGAGEAVGEGDRLVELDQDGGGLLNKDDITASVGVGDDLRFNPCRG